MKLRRVRPLNKTELAFLEMLDRTASARDGKLSVLPEMIDWHLIGRMAEAHDLKNMLYGFGRTCDWYADMPGDLAESFRLRFIQTAITNTRFRDEMIWISREMNRSGIRPVILKGGALMSFTFPDQGLRRCADLDILVAETELETACGILKRRGFILDESAQTAAFYRRHHFHYIFRDPSRPWCCVEVHWNISIPQMGVNIPIDQFRDRAREHSLEHAHMRVFEPADFLLHLCLHSSLNMFSKLSQVFDVHYLLNHEARDIDPVAFWTNVRYCRLSVTVATCLLLSRVFGPNEARERLLGCRSLVPDIHRISHLVNFEGVLRQDMLTVLTLGNAITTYRRDRWIDRIRYRIDKAVPSGMDTGFDRYRTRGDKPNPGKRLSVSGLKAILRSEIYSCLSKYGYEITRDHFPGRSTEIV